MVSEPEPKRIAGGEGNTLPPEGTPFLNIGLSEIYFEAKYNQESRRYNTSNVCGSYLPVGARWEEIEEMGWSQPIVHFVFQSEELAQRARLTFGFTNTSAPFSITSERVGAEYQVKFKYIGEAVFQPGQQLVVYYNGVPAGWLWIRPYIAAGEISWSHEWNPARWQMQNPIEPALIEGGTIPGLPVNTQGNEANDALILTIEQTYAQWSETPNIDLTYHCVDNLDNEMTKTFFNKDVVDVDSSADELTLFIHGKWVNWFNDWDIVQVKKLEATIDDILWGDFTIEMSFSVGN